MKKRNKAQQERLVVEEREDGSLFIPIPEQILKEYGWRDGDDIELKSTGNGFYLRKVRSRR